MAKQNYLVDDVNTKSTEGVETRTFAIGGQRYRIDLSEENWAKLQGAVDRFVKVATPLGGAGSADSRLKVDRDETAKIREWAQANGHVIGERGRIPNAVVTAYRAAQEAPSSTTGRKPARSAATKPATARTAPTKRAPRKTAPKTTGPKLNDSAEIAPASVGEAEMFSEVSE